MFDIALWSYRYCVGLVDRRTYIGTKHVRSHLNIMDNGTLIKCMTINWGPRFFFLHLWSFVFSHYLSFLIDLCYSGGGC